MSLFSKKGKLILLHNNLQKLPKADSYDLLLSPQFYFVKREHLPIKYSFQAKKLAPSILEELLPSELGYEYIVQKDGNYWLFFAYRPKEIENFLKGCCKVAPNKINKIYFADQLKHILQKAPIGVDEHYAITLIDGFATIVPRAMLESDKFIKFSEKLRPSIGYKFKPSTKAKSSAEISKAALAAAILLILLGAAFITEGVSYKKAIDKLYAKIDSITSDYPQLKSKLTRESIKAKYSKLEKKQRAIRENLELFSQLSSKKTLLDSLSLNQNAIEAKFSVDSKEIKKVKNIIKSTKLKIANESGNSVTVLGELKWVKIF